MTKPNLFIVGGPKCGTTSLFEYLGEHPEIDNCSIKEPQFFNSNRRSQDIKTLEQYLNLFKISKYSKYYCEASTSYYLNKHTIQAILNYNPNSKFIFLLRNPIELFFSLHKQLYFDGEENIKSPEKAWRMSESRSINKNIPISCAEPQKLIYSNVCSLGKHLKSLKNMVNEKNLYVNFSQNLKEDPCKLTSEIFKFLNISCTEINADLLNKSNKSRYSFRLHRAIKAYYRLKTKLNLNFSTGILNHVKSLNHIKDKKRPIYTNNIKFEKELKNFFRDDIKIIENETSKDLSSWFV